MLPPATVALALSVELLTIGPGAAAPWGDCALRLIDRPGDTDFVYASPAPEREYYSVSVRKWAADDRTITRRPLRLTPEAAEKIAARLKNGAFEPPKEVFDRGAETIAEILDSATGGALRNLGDRPLPGTVRERILDNIRSHTINYLALDLTLDPALHRPATRWEMRVLCAELGELVAKAEPAGAKLVSEERDEYRSKSIDPHDSWSWPWVLVYIFFTAPFVLVAMLFPRAGTAVFGGSIALVGMRLLLSGAPAAAVLVFCPLLVLLLHTALRRYARIYLGLYASFLLLALILPFGAAFHPAIGAVLPVAIMLLLRLENPRSS